MVFNTGAALLDAIVLAVVSREPEGAYGYRRTSVSRSMTVNARAGTGDTTRRRKRGGCS